MFMKNTCLYPFYAYIFEQLKHGKTLLDYENIFDFSRNHVSCLDNRKKEIWCNTRNILNLENELEKHRYLEELKSKKIDCGLCMKCISCEIFYWNELEKLLFKNADRLEAKSSLMLPETIKQLLEKREKPVELYLDYHRRHHIQNRNCMVILKGFSSSTPMLLNYASNDSCYRGGGFFIRWNGKGIAVDPGYLFVQNLHQEGYSVLDVDIVIVTHEHIDHSSDIRLLDDLHYHAAVNNEDYRYKWNSEEYTVDKEKVSTHKISWYLDAVTYDIVQILAKKGSGFDQSCNELFKVDVEKEDEISITDDIKMRIFLTYHEMYKNKEKTEFYKHTFGVCFECNSVAGSKRVIGYTSDTSLSVDDTFKENMMQKFETCDILIANISGIYEDDILLENKKKKHLGYFGCYEIIYELMKKSTLNLKYCFLSEFSNQVTDIRYDVSKYMQSETNKIAKRYRHTQPLIVPAENGVTMDLDSLMIQCTECKRFSDKIHILRPSGENHKLRYVCNECMYSNE